jgi:hypothetical protein
MHRARARDGHAEPMARHCATGPARSGRPDYKLREAIQAEMPHWIASSLTLLALTTAILLTHTI